MEIEIWIDPLTGFVYVDGVKLPMKYNPGNDTLEFCIKDARIAAARGGRFIEVPASSLAGLSSGGKADFEE